MSNLTDYLRTPSSPTAQMRTRFRILAPAASMPAAIRSSAIEKLIAYMTVDQRGAIAVFEELGFHVEAMLREHVKDRDGTKHDVVMLSHDVIKFLARMEVFGLTETS